VKKNLSHKNQWSKKQCLKRTLEVSCAVGLSEQCELHRPHNSLDWPPQPGHCNVSQCRRRGDKDLRTARKQFSSITSPTQTTLEDVDRHDTMIKHFAAERAKLRHQDRNVRLWPQSCPGAAVRGRQLGGGTFLHSLYRYRHCFSPSVCLLLKVIC
jgi:hypothetical protein